MTDEKDSAERIRARAYELYVARGEHPGRAEDDWLQAEREILVGERPGNPVDDQSLGATAEPIMQTDNGGGPNGQVPTRGRKAESGRRVRRQ